MKKRFTRRKFMQDAALVTTSLAVAPELTPELKAAGKRPAAKFTSGWSNTLDRVWLGPECWANPMQDWRIGGGRLKCVNAAPNRSVHLLTRELSKGQGELRMSVQVNRGGGGVLNKGSGSAGFRIGIMGPLGEYRNNLIYGTGLTCGTFGRRTGAASGEL